MHELSQEIAAQAARWIVEEGLDYGAAKRRALKELGLSSSKAALPSNDLVEEEVIAYLRIFCADTQPQELYALRQTALVWMKRLEPFIPHLSGAVWRGTATRLNDIHIQLFCDDSKEAEIELINKGVNFEVRAITGFRGEEVDALSLSTFCEGLQEEVGLHLMIYDHDDLRGALSGTGKTKESRTGSGAGSKQSLDDALAPSTGASHDPHSNALNASTDQQTLQALQFPKSPIGSLKALSELLEQTRSLTALR